MGRVEGYRLVFSNIKGKVVPEKVEIWTTKEEAEQEIRENFT